jgi:hypothetical protein
VIKRGTWLERLKAEKLSINFGRILKDAMKKLFDQGNDQLMSRIPIASSTHNNTPTSNNNIATSSSMSYNSSSPRASPIPARRTNTGNSNGGGESVYSASNLSTSNAVNLADGNLTETRKRQGKRDEVS